MHSLLSLSERQHSQEQTHQDLIRNLWALIMSCIAGTEMNASSSEPAPEALKDLMQHLSLSHADSNDLVHPSDAAQTLGGSPRLLDDPAQLAKWRSPVQGQAAAGSAMLDYHPSHAQYARQWGTLTRGPSTAFHPSLRPSQESYQSNLATPTFSQRDARELGQHQAYELQPAQLQAQQQWHSADTVLPNLDALHAQQQASAIAKDAQAFSQQAQRHSRELDRRSLEQQRSLHQSQQSTSSSQAFAQLRGLSSDREHQQLRMQSRYFLLLSI